MAVSFNYSRLRVGGVSEAEFVARRADVEAPGYEARWEELKRAFEREFIDGLKTQWPAGAVHAVPRGPGVGLVVVPIYLSLGRFAYVGQARTSMSATMGWIVNGQPVEEIEVSDWSGSSVFNPSVVTHVVKIGGTMGERAGEYLTSRQ